MDSARDCRESLNTSITSIQSSIILPCTINGSAHSVGFQRVGSIVCMMVPAKSTTGSNIVIIFSTALPQIYRLSGSGSLSMTSFLRLTIMVYQKLLVWVILMTKDESELQLQMDSQVSVI